MSRLELIIKSKNVTTCLDSICLSDFLPDISANVLQSTTSNKHPRPLQLCCLSSDNLSQTTHSYCDKFLEWSLGLYGLYYINGQKYMCIQV